MRPGDWAALCLVAEALVIDAVLVATKRDTISSCIRSRTPAKAGVVLVCAHLVRSWRRDPLGRLPRCSVTLQMQSRTLDP